ncbi:hypothetical protein [Halobaculum magnesiiphilum]|uniref:Nickel/cobalt efflux system n=1 Tax=Halobaculum magnesiiphilum TaxID=1017351 RepID=A0A8T8WHE3_9EURY|nr:hypothetical protein [Halobaculum magnesiiphilum]QZP39269.1 hypothetical protein K6T50_16580 [Halobaculum magnesiiphilum]
MLHNDALSLLLGAVVLGAVHGVEPGHGWPVAAAYALDQTNKWLYGFVSSLIIGVGHLISSLAIVAVFFYAKSYFSLTQINEPVTLFSGIQIGGPVSLVAGILLILLGIREYTGHSHDDGHSHGEAGHTDEAHEHGHETEHTHEDGHDHGNVHDHDHETASTAISGGFTRVKNRITGGGHSHDHGELNQAAERGLFGIAWFAFILGFAHEEEFEIIAMCAGSQYCLELMSVYAITVILGIVGLTMLLVAGYTHYEEKVEQYTPYLPLFSAAVLILMGLGFITGLY